MSALRHAIYATRDGVLRGDRASVAGGDAQVLRGDAMKNVVETISAFIGLDDDGEGIAAFLDPAKPHRRV
jgi:hypothetical protein